MGRKSTVRKADLVRAIEDENGDVGAIAARFGRSRATINRRIEVLGLGDVVYETRRGWLAELVTAAGGVVSNAASRAGVSRQTMYDYVRDFELWPVIHQARERLSDMAFDNVMAWVDAGDKDMTKFVLTSYPGGPRWSSKTEVEVSGVGLSAEVMEMMQELGVDVETAAEAFEAQIRRMHAEAMIDG